MSKLFLLISSYRHFIFKIIFFELFNIAKSFKYKEFKDSFNTPPNNSIYKDSVEYVPTPYYFLKFSLSFIKAKRGSIIDIGCGSGRVLRFYKNSFKNHKINFIGIDLDKYSLNAAKKFQKNATFINQDASEFIFPKDTFLIFMFNPFGEMTMKKVINNLKTQKETFIYKVRIVYVSPIHIELFSKNFKLIQQNINKHNKGIAIFEI